MARRTPIDPPSLRPGTITAVRAQKKDPDRVSVFIDDEFAFGLAGEVAFQNGLRKGLELSVAQQEDLIHQEHRAAARSLALHFIGHRPRTQAEVQRRLDRAGFEQEAVREAVERMIELGYLDDAAYAQTFVAERLRTKRHGPGRLRADLLRRGVPRETIEQALDAQIDDERMRQDAIELARTRWQRLHREADPRRKRKRVADYLARRGFPSDLIREALQRAAETDDLA